MFEQFARLLGFAVLLVPAGTDGRLPTKFPKSGRVLQMSRPLHHDVVDAEMPVTPLGHIVVIATQGQTVWHMSRVSDPGTGVDTIHP